MRKKNIIGLTDEQVLQSRALHGSNVLTPKEKRATWKRFAEKLTGPLGHRLGWNDGDPLVFILEIAALLSITISLCEYNGWLGLHPQAATVFFEPVGILIAILLATGIAFYFELKADHEFSLLNQVKDEEPVQVIRNGHPTRVPKSDIVVGDVVIIETGCEIPADAELIEATQLTLDESSLTGEPSCRKTTVAESFDADATFPSNHVMRGTKVMEGHGLCRVFAVGDNTENGRVFESVQIDNSVKTPLNEQLDALGMLITKASYTIAALITIGRIAEYFINDGSAYWADLLAYLLQTVMIAVTLIVVAVPEGLPMAVSLALAYSMRRMLKANNLVRRMHACETMGAATVICTDKTGTLTQNRMQVAADDFPGFTHSGERQTLPLLVQEAIALNTTARIDHTSDQGRNGLQVLGNPTEAALLLWLEKQGYNYETLRQQAERIDELPFSTERKYMATLVQSANGQRVLHVKGAPEIVLAACEDVDDRENILRRLQKYQKQAMRTLAFAWAEVDEGQNPIHDNRIVPCNLKWLGMVAISDPVRPDVPPAVAECQQAGIEVKIVTGDTPDTAREIGKQTGLWKEGDGERNIITGPEFATLTDEQLMERVDELKIIARARPMDKKRLVEALQRAGHVVAVTGDGTNDAPALKAAHVGLSMGDGTSVAKEASDITIIDNSFASIGRAVLWGRSLYLNIQRFILFQLTVNVCACLVVLVGAFMGTESPLTVTQMLWVNLIMDTFAAIALASLPPSKHVMNDKPRPRKAFIISRPMAWRITLIGTLFAVILIFLFRILHLSNYDSLTALIQAFLTEGTSALHGSHKILSSIELSVFFTIFVMLQFWNMFNARAFMTGHSAFRLKGCQEFLFITAIIFLGQVAITEIGRQFFSVEPISISDWIIIIVTTSLVLWVGEACRFFRKNKWNAN